LSNLDNETQEVSDLVKVCDSKSSKKIFLVSCPFGFALSDLEEYLRKDKEIEFVELDKALEEKIIGEVSRDEILNVLKGNHHIDEAIKITAKEVFQKLKSEAFSLPEKELHEKEVD
jgi:invasion protein IalB